MITFQISPQRMGSTWQFNTARQLLLLDNKLADSFYSDISKDWEKFDTRPDMNFLVKSHTINPVEVRALAERFEVKLLFSFRNIFETVKSSRRVFPKQSDRVTIKGINES